jgi:glutaredoxin
MRVTLAFLIAATTTTTSLQAGELFRWVDPASGAAVYSNDPPPAAVKSVQQKRIAPNTIETSSLPYGVQQAVKRSPIVLYVSDCGEFCKAARTYLAKRGVPFTERNPEQPAHAEQLKKVSSGALEVPFLMVGTKAIRGFDEARYASALEAAGYPKSSLAALGAKPVPPKTPIPVANGSKAPDPAVAESASPPAAKEGEDAGRTMLHRLLASLDGVF